MSSALIDRSVTSARDAPRVSRLGRATGPLNGSGAVLVGQARLTVRAVGLLQDVQHRVAVPTRLARDHLVGRVELPTTLASPRRVHLEREGKDALIAVDPVDES